MRIGALFTLALTLAACSSAGVTGTSGRRAGKDDGGGTSGTGTAQGHTDSGDPSDAPVWVNAAYLTCAWAGASTATTVQVLCGLDEQSGAPIKPDPHARIAWVVTDDAGKTVAGAGAPAGSGERIEQLFTFAATDANHREIGCGVNGAAPTAKSTATLAQTLPGFKSGPDLAACFAGGTAASDCLGAYAGPGPVTATGTQGVSPALPNAGTRRIFATTTQYTGDLGGIAGADAKCNTDAKAFALGGTWQAVISDSTTNINARDVIKGTASLVDVKHIAVAASVDALFSSKSAGAVPNEIGVKLTAPAHAWTGTLASGLLDPNNDCTGWKSSSAAHTAAVGDTTNSATWLYDNDSFTCDLPAHLYCVETGY